MLYEFFMTPELFDKSNACRGEVILLQLLRNMEKNGLLANPNKDKWVPYVEEKIKKLEPALRDKILTCFKKLEDQHRFVRHPKRMEGDPITDQDWLNLALNSHKQIPFHAIILSQELIDSCTCKCTEFVEFFDSLESEKWIDRKEILSLTKSTENFASVLDPVLRYARSIALIDPYLDPRKSRFYNTIEICSSLLGKRRQGHNGLHGRIDIHLAEGQGKGKKRNEPKENFFAACEEKLQQLIDKDSHCFRIFIWKESKLQHNRYILTDQFGIIAPWGLDCDSQSTKKDHWSSLPKRELDELWDQFHPEVDQSELVGRKKFPWNCVRKIHKNESYAE